MSGRRDPVEQAAGTRRDLYDIATWEPRTRLDRIAGGIYVGIVRTVRTVVVGVALVILAAQFALTSLAAVTNPVVGVFTLLSIVPAFVIAAYVWRSDAVVREPLRPLVGTFLLGVLFAGFAAVLNTSAQPAFAGVPVVGMALFFYLVVAPGEEFVKWLAVRLYAYRRFDAVVDGAVYGVVAGLGFATIENAIFIGGEYLSAARNGAMAGPLVAETVRTAAVRTFAGPGHVIYSGFAGYYLGLAKYNRANAGPIVVKGLLVAAVLHATYNTLVGVVPPMVNVLEPRVPIPAAFIGFVMVYDGVFGYALYRKIARYRRTYVESGAARFQRAAEPTSGRGRDGDDGTTGGDGDDGHGGSTSAGPAPEMRLREVDEGPWPGGTSGMVDDDGGTDSGGDDYGR